MSKQNERGFGTAEGARKLAIDIALRALIDHESASDPDLKDRPVAMVGAYTAQL